MSTWTPIDPNRLLPSGLVAAVSALGDALTAAISTVKDPLAGFASVSLPSVGDPVTLVVNAILDTLKDLLTAGRIHILTIPIAKTVPGWTPPPLPSTIKDLQTALATRLGPTTTAAADAYTAMVANNGGNAGFYQAFATATADPQDPNRPQYIETDAVAMAVLLAGAPRFSAIVSAATTLNILTRPIGNNDLTARVIPVPQGLTSKVVGASTSSSGVGVRLDWDAPGNGIPLYFPGIQFTVNRYAVIRTTDPKATRARNVLDLFSTATLTEGLTSGKAKVVKIGSGKNTAYLDASENAAPGIPIYYFVAWECVLNENGTKTTLAFDKLSGVTKVTAIAPTPAQTGASPNWVASPTGIGAFPALGNAANLLNEEARVLLKTKANPASRVSAAVKLSQDAATRLAARSTELIDDVKRLSTVLAAPMPSLYVTQMSSSKGGNAFLLAELGTRLGNTADTSRPPFDDGEYVCGLCFVAGAPRIADLSKIIAFFNALFGSATPANPLLGVLEAIDTLVTQAETAVFQPDMVQFPAGTDLTNIDPTTGSPIVPPLPVVAQDGVAVDTMSPANPNAGDTNITPLSELC